AAALLRLRGAPLVVEEVPERRHDEGPELPLLRIDAAQQVLLQQVAQEGLGQILGAFDGLPLAADEEVDGLPVVASQLLDRLRFAVLGLQDDLPQRGLEAAVLAAHGGFLSHSAFSVPGKPRPATLRWTVEMQRFHRFLQTDAVRLTSSGR